MVPFKKENILILIKSILIDNANTLKLEKSKFESIRFDTKIKDRGLNLDSIELISVVSILNRFFCLYEIGTDQNLLRAKRVGDWVDLIYDSFNYYYQRNNDLNLTFYTSGTTGNKKMVTHRYSILKYEVDFIYKLLEYPERIFYELLPHHLYGFIFTIMLSNIYNVEVIQFKDKSIQYFKNNITNKDVIVTYPLFWNYINNSIDKFTSNTKGVNSAGKIDKNTISELLKKGITHFYDIYGSTETGGVGYKVNLNDYFTFFDYINYDNSKNIIIKKIGDSNISYPVMDKIKVKNNRFILKGRIDKKIKIGGVNISLNNIKERILKNEYIRDCAVRPTTVNKDKRLKLFIVLKEDYKPTKIIKNNIKKYIKKNFIPAEYPVTIKYGKKIPVNSMGKLIDW